MKTFKHKLNIAIISIISLLLCFMGILTIKQTKAIDLQPQEQTENTLNINDCYYANLSGVTDFVELKNTLFFVKENKLCKFDKESQTLVNSSTTFLNAKNMIVCNDYIFIINNGVIECYNYDMQKVELKYNSENKNILSISFDIQYINNNYVISNINSSNEIKIFKLENVNNEYLKLNSTQDINSLQIKEVINDYDTKIVTLNDNLLYIVLNSNTKTALYKLDYSKPQIDKEIKPCNLTDANITKCTIKEIDNKKLLLLSASNKQQLFAYTLSSLDGENPTPYISKDQVNISGSHAFKLGNISEYSDFEVYNNEILILDSKNKCVQSFYINNEKNTLDAKSVVLASAGYDNGRFNNISKVYAQSDNEFFVVDSGNKRIQQINLTEKTPSFFNIENIKNDEISKNSICVNNETKELIYSNKTENLKNGQIILTKYSSNNTASLTLSSYIAKNTTKTNLSKNLLFNIDDNNNFYAINFDTQNSILKLSYKNNSYELSEVTNNPITEDISTALDMLVLNENEIVLLLPNKLVFANFKENLTSEINLNESNNIELSKDYFDNLYILNSNNSILKLLKSDNYNLENAKKLQISEKFKITNFSVIQSSNTILAFDCLDNKFIKVDNNNFYNGMQDFSHPENIAEIVATSKTHKTAKIKPNTYCYDYPKNIGNRYLLNSLQDTLSLTNDYKQNVILLSSLQNGYSYILFNSNNKLKSGYVKTSALLEIKENLEETNEQFITINSSVKVYKYPTLLKFNNSGLILPKKFAINSPVIVINKNVDSIEKSLFYAIKYDTNKVGYINQCDLISEAEIPIKPTIKYNAEVFTAGALESVNIYNSNLENKEIKTTLKNGYKIIVENYDDKKELTEIKFYDSNFNLQTGFIETKYIKLNKNNNALLLSILIVSTIAFVILLIVAFYLIFKKKNNLNKEIIQ